MRILKRSDRQSEALPRPVAAAICDGGCSQSQPYTTQSTHTEYLLLLFSSQFQIHLHKKTHHHDIRYCHNLKLFVMAKYLYTLSGNWDTLLPPHLFHSWLLHCKKPQFPPHLFYPFLLYLLAILTIHTHIVLQYFSQCFPILHRILGKGE